MALTTRKWYGLKGYTRLYRVSGNEWVLEAAASRLPARSKCRDTGTMSLYTTPRWGIIQSASILRLVQSLNNLSTSHFSLECLPAFWYKSDYFAIINSAWNGKQILNTNWANVYLSKCWFCKTRKAKRYCSPIENLLDPICCGENRLKKVDINKIVQVFLRLNDIH